MIPDRHELPEKVFLALAAGSGGAQAITHLKAAQYSKRLLLLRGVREATVALRHPAERQVRQAYSLLSRLQPVAPEAVDAVLLHPSVGAWAHHTLLALGNGGDADPGRLAAIGAAAAAQARFPAETIVPPHAGGVLLPSLGTVTLPGSAVTSAALVRTGKGRTEVSASGRSVRLPADLRNDAPGWRALQRLDAEYLGIGIRLILDDVDPYRMPGVAVAAERLTGRRLEHWRVTLRRAWRLLVRDHWTTAEEVAAAISVLTPMAEPAHGHVSSTCYEASGAIGLSTPADDHVMAVTLAHETQHAKLAALIDIVPLVRPDDGRRYYAPWRDDPRPIGGLLQGVYAHLAIAGYWRRQRRHEPPGEPALRAHREFALWRDAATLAARTLAASGRLTSAGERFVAEMRRTLRSWHHEQVPSAALEQARDIAAQHRGRWRARNGTPPEGQDEL